MENRLINRHRKMAIHKQDDTWIGHPQVFPEAEEVVRKDPPGFLKQKRKRRIRRIINNQERVLWLKKIMEKYPKDHWIRRLYKI